MRSSFIFLFLQRGVVVDMSSSFGRKVWIIFRHLLFRINFTIFILNRWVQVIVWVAQRFRCFGRQKFYLQHQICQPLFVDFFVDLDFVLQLINILLGLIRLVTEFFQLVITFLQYRFHIIFPVVFGQCLHDKTHLSAHNITLFDILFQGTDPFFNFGMHFDLAASQNMYSL